MLFEPADSILAWAQKRLAGLRHSQGLAAQVGWAQPPFEWMDLKPLITVNLTQLNGLALVTQAGWALDWVE